MIPKILHYCWFSYPENYPDDVQRCIASWKSKLADYEIKIWNAKNFDVTILPYVEEAYREGMYAFASDYVRLWALYHYGGIYLDSDVEVLKDFDDLLSNKAFTGLEDENWVGPWILGSEKGNPLFKEFMDYYEGRHFLLPDGQYDLTANSHPVTEQLLAHGFRRVNEIQHLDQITIYPMTFFCPFNPYRQAGECFSERSYTIHYFNGAWIKAEQEK